MKAGLLRFVLTVVFISLFASTGASALTYSMTLIPNTYNAYHLNNFNETVGNMPADATTANQLPYIYSAGVVSTIPDVPATTDTSANSINDSDMIVGAYKDPDAGYSSFLYWGGSSTKLFTFVYKDGSTGYTYATDINNSNSIVGSSAISAGGPHHAFIIQGGHLFDIGTLGGKNSVAAAVNENNQVVGYSANSSTGISAFVYDSLNGIKELGSLVPDHASVATDINNLGQIIGFSDDTSGNSHAVIFHDGTAADLGFLAGGDDSTANAINDLGQIVGYSTLAPGGSDTHAFLYQSGVLTDLNSLIVGSGDWVVYNAYDINNNGYIAGFAINSVTNQQQAVLLAPATASVPLPAALPSGLILLGCLIGLGLNRKTK